LLVVVAVAHGALGKTVHRVVLVVLVMGMPPIISMLRAVATVVILVKQQQFGAAGPVALEVLVLETKV
jgi:hypothetical protein